MFSKCSQCFSQPRASNTRVLWNVRDRRNQHKNANNCSIRIDFLGLFACGNTHRKMSEKAGEQLALLDEASMVPSGVVRLVELQEQGYAYVRP